MHSPWHTLVLVAACVAASGAAAQGGGLYLLQQLPMELQQLAQRPASATAYCEGEAMTGSLAPDQKTPFLQHCLGTTIRADPFMFVRCRSQTTGLEGKDYLDRYHACLLASGGQRD